MFSAACLGQC